MRQRRGQRAHRRDAGGMAEFGLQILQAPLGFLPIGQVAHEAGEQLFAMILHFADRQFDRKGGAIAPARGGQSADADDPLLAGVMIMLQVGIMALAIGRGHQHRDIAAQHIGFGILEHALGGRAERDDMPGRVDHDQRIGHRCQDRSQQSLFPAGRIILRIAIVERHVRSLTVNQCASKSGTRVSARI